MARLLLVKQWGRARVVAAVGDPNPKVDGRGFERLRAAGVEVEVADLWEARVQNEAWRVWIARGRPFLTALARMPSVPRPFTMRSLTG